ncbi:MAG TPA: serine/threonine-protein kinase [Candidatus Dormibacteraeota bacterium]|nr:serine/threonine-protein kinase [Candidatus Dormibacteraeota bacterium]
MARSVRVAHDRAPFGMRGRDLLGRYKLGRPLSRDSSGTLYKAKDARSGAVVAVRELAPELVADTRFLERFRAESGVLTRLDHPNCGKVLDFLEVEGRAYIVSEPIEGRTLREVIGGATLRPAQALALLRGSLVGLGAAHSLGLLHRSLRPESVVVQPNGLVKLTGFDQPAYAAGAAPGEAASAGISPYAYIAPDQVVGAEADVRTDVYLAGILGFELLTGGPPFTSLDPSELMFMHVTQDPPDLNALRPEVTVPVADIVNRALAKEPEHRQQSAREFIAQIDAATAALGVEWTEAVVVSGLGAAAMAGGSTLAGGEKPNRGATPGGARVGRRPRSVLVPGVAALTIALSGAAYGYSQRWLGVGAGVNPGLRSMSTAPHSGGSPAHGRAPSDLAPKPPSTELTPPGAEGPPVAVLLPAQPAPGTRVAVRVGWTQQPAVVSLISTNPAAPPPAPPTTAPVPPGIAPGSAPAASMDGEGVLVRRAAAVGRNLRPAGGDVRHGELATGRQIRGQVGGPGRPGPGPGRPGPRQEDHGDQGDDRQEGHGHHVGEV